MRDIAGGHGAFLHRFEQCRLRLRSRAVDFVGEDEVGKDGSRMKAHALRAAIIRLDHHGSDDVARHQVWSELDAGVFQVQDSGKGPQQGGFAQPGDAFEQHVSAGEQADDNAIHHFLLTDDDFGDFLADSL
jgi:hypothetical protein